MPLDRESCELLRAIVRRPTDGNCEQLALLVARIHDWDALLTAARQHGVLVMLYLRLANHCDPIPPTTFERMRADYNRNAFHSLTNAAELIDVLTEFDEKQIPAMPFKGVVLGASVYHDLTTRPAGDLDLLIFLRDLKKATEILLKRGYELKAPTSEDGSPMALDYEYHFERRSDGMAMELRWRLELTEPRFRRNLGMDWVWPRRQVTTLAGAKVPNLDPATALLVLCMHGSKHVWSRLIWICDVARLISSQPGLNWYDVKKEAKRTGLWRALTLGVLLAHKVAGATVPQPVLEAFEADATARNLTEHFNQNLFSSLDRTPKGIVPYNIHLLGFRDRARILLSLELLRPSDRDRAAIHQGKGSTRPERWYSRFSGAAWPNAVNSE